MQPVKLLTVIVICGFLQLVYTKHFDIIWGESLRSALASPHFHANQKQTVLFPRFQASQPDELTIEEQEILEVIDDGDMEDWVKVLTFELCCWI